MTVNRSWLSNVLVVCTALTSVSLGTQARGDIITLAKYGFDSASLSPTETASGVSAGAIQVTGYTLGSGDTTGVYYGTSSGGNPGGEFRVYFHNTVAGVNNTEAGAATENRYFDIVLAPSGSDPLRLSALSLDARGTNTSNFRTFFVRYNHSGEDPLNAFAGPSVLSGTIPTTTNAYTSFASPDNLAGLPDIMPGETLTLRLFQYRAIQESFSGAQNIRYDNITITGMVVPEPASVLLVLLAVVGFVAARPRRRP